MVTLLTYTIACTDILKVMLITCILMISPGYLYNQYISVSSGIVWLPLYNMIG